jgi:hypothetical protein
LLLISYRVRGSGGKLNRRPASFDMMIWSYG